MESEEVDQGEVLRYLTECIWFPSALLSDSIRWEPVNDNTAKANIRYSDKEASAIFHFTEEGELYKITAKRFREVDGEFSLDDWEVSNFEYKEINGFKIPYKAHVKWMLEDGELCYYKLKITEIKYNSCANS